MRDTDTKLRGLGSRLKDERLRRNETQGIFAARIGVSVPTLRKMESGDPTVQIGYWSIALDVLDRSGELDVVLAVPEDLFSKYSQITDRQRHRASKRVS